MWITCQHLVGTLTDEDDLQSKIASCAAQDIFSRAVEIDAEGLGVPNRVRKVVEQIALGEPHRCGDRPSPLRGLFRDLQLVVSVSIEAQGEATNRLRRVQLSESEHRAAVQSSA